MPHLGPPGPAPFTCPSRNNEKVRHPSVSRSSGSDPCVPALASTETSPLGHTSQGGQDRLFLVAALPAPGLPTVLLTHTCSQLPWGGRTEGREAQFHLDPATPGGFSEPGVGPPSCIIAFQWR